MKNYLKKVVSFLNSLGYDADTISRILGVSVETVKKFIPILNGGGKVNE